MANPMQYEIALDSKGVGTIILNGEDVSHRVRGVRFIAQAGELSELEIEYLDARVVTWKGAEGTIRGEPMGDD